MPTTVSISSFTILLAIGRAAAAEPEPAPVPVGPPPPTLPAPPAPSTPPAATPAPPGPKATGTGRSETGWQVQVGILQYVVATGLAFGGTIAVINMLYSDRAAPAVGLALATPIAVGGAVCGIGRSSASGSCWAPIGGALAGALTSIPLVCLLSAPQSGCEGGDLSKYQLGVAIGLLVVQPLASPIAWHVFKRRRPATH